MLFLLYVYSIFFFFFFSSRRRHTRYWRDWSSDVCSSDLEALDATRRSYGKMLEAGATSWWEHFGGFASLCHAWSTGPNSDLSGYVLGVQPTEPGYAAFRVEPHPADLTWAKGVVPTVRGDVSVNWKRHGSIFELSVSVP